MKVSSKVDKIKLKEYQDRRVKLSKEIKKEIYDLYHNIGGYSLNKLALKYNVSKKTILLIVNKNSKEKNDNYIKKNWRNFYDKEEHTKAMQNLRKYKRELLEKGDL